MQDLIYGSIPFDHVFGAWADRQRGWRASERIPTFRFALDELRAGRSNPLPLTTKRYAEKDALASLLLRHAQYGY